MEETTKVAAGSILSDDAKTIGDAIDDFAAIFIWLFNKIKELLAKIGL